MKRIPAYKLNWLMRLLTLLFNLDSHPHFAGLRIAGWAFMFRARIAKCKDGTFEPRDWLPKDVIWTYGREWSLRIVRLHISVWRVSLRAMAEAYTTAQ